MTIPGTAGARPAGRYDGTEATKSIWLVVDPRGRLLSVDIRRTWRDRIQPERFGAALAEAYRAAAHAARAATSAAGGIEPRERPDHESLVADCLDLPTGQWLAVIGAELHRIGNRLRALDEADAAPEREVRSPNGYVTLRLRGRGLTDIAADPYTLKLAPAERLGQDVLAAFRGAGLAAE